jgi:hypothetical protein
MIQVLQVVDARGPMRTLGVVHFNAGGVERVGLGAWRENEIVVGEEIQASLEDVFAHHFPLPKVNCTRFGLEELEVFDGAHGLFNATKL